MIKSLETAGTKMTLPELKKILTEIRRIEMHRVDQLKDQKDNPSVRSMYDQAYGRFELSAAILDALNGNQIDLKSLL